MSADMAAAPAAKWLPNAIFPKNAPTFARLLTIYRFSSFMLTSALYLLSPQASWAPYKYIVVAALAIASVIINTLLNLHAGDMKFITFMVIVETAGIAFLLVPTGGMDSPYLWYALNPVLVAACYLRQYYCWILLGFFSATAASVSAILFSGEYEGVGQFIERRGLWFLVFILTVLAMQLLARLVRKKMQEEAELKSQKEELDAVNGKLKQLNEKLEESVDDLLSLYHSVDDLVVETDQSVVVSSLTQYAARLSKSGFSFFIVSGGEANGSRTVFCGESEAMEEIKSRADQLIDGIACYEEPVVVPIGECEFLVLAVKSTTTLYGLLGIGTHTGGTGKANAVDNSRIGFIANLCSIVLERMGAKEVENRLTIAQERNRIADEIHDSICQRLFSITCSAHSLVSRLDGIGRQELQEQLALIEDCSKTANQEIRLCIYGLSSKKRKVNMLFEELEKYLWSYAKLNSIVLNIDLKGDDSLLDASLQKSLTRIVREACGNAARHGKCKNIGVKLLIQDKNVLLRISDDGIGFSVDDDRSGTPSVGLLNMKSMVERYGGTIELESQLQKGTTITVNIPLFHEYDMENREMAQ